MSQEPMQIQIGEQQFKQRFTIIKQYNDAFGRQYFITNDKKTNKRTIYKHYLSQTQQQNEAIFGNIQNYIKLSQQDNICKIISCTRINNNQQVLAAFQYDQLTLGQFLETNQFNANKTIFYIHLLSSLANIIKSMTQIGIDIDQINYGNILVSNFKSITSQSSQQNLINQNNIKIKIFYDQRQKSYDKILQGIKTFTSVQKLTALLTGNQDYFNQLMELPDPISPQNIYQLGLLLIDLMYMAETQQLPTSTDDFIVRDRPVSRSAILNSQKSYYHIEDGRIISLNQDFLNQKIKHLQTNCSHVIKQLVNLTRYMIAKQQQRINILELFGQIDRIYKIYKDSSKKIIRSVSNDSKSNKQSSAQYIKSLSSGSVSSRKNQSYNRKIVEQNGNNHIISNTNNNVNIIEETTNVLRSRNGGSNGSTKSKKKVQQIIQKHSNHQNILTQLEQDNNHKHQLTYNKKQPQNKTLEKKYNQDNKNPISNPFYNNQAVILSNGNSNINYAPSSTSQGLFSSYSSHKNQYTTQVNKDQKLRQAANSNTLSTTKQTIGSKTSYTNVVNQHFNNNSNTTIYQNQKLKPGFSNPNIKRQDISNQKPIKMIIPKQHILINLKAHQSIKSSLQNLIRQIQMFPQLKKKQYYDNSVYYGEVSSKTNKRSGLGIYVYPSGDIYFGTWLQNQLINGTYIFKNGQSYQGSVKNGKQGWGRYRYSNGNVYQGQWKDDIKEGKGTMWYPNQDKYQGEWVKGKKNGWGKYYYNNGTIYEGNFLNGRKHGFGTITFSNGTKIQANWHQTHVQGQGKVFYPNGDFFHGQYYMSQKHGKGLYIWSADNTKYEGQFKKDSLQGQAKIYFTPSEYYFGRIRNGKRDGQGTYSYQNGDLFNGQWKNDMKLIGHYKFKNGDEFQGKFKQNQLNFGVLKYSNGQIYEGQFRNGYRHGVGSYRSSEGELVCEGHWQNDNFISSGH